MESDKLIDFVTNLAGDRFLKVENDLGDGFFRLNIGEAERRQAKHDIRSVEDVVVELVRNSRDAGAGRIFLASAKETSGARNLTILDDGAGVPESCHGLIFEPRVTTKIDNFIEDRFGVHGRGMALYSIRSNVEEVRLVNSSVNRGAILKLIINTNRLRERKDQSTFPKIKMSGEKTRIVSGPHNIWRHLVELSLETPSLHIFFGTGAEILATLIAQSKKAPGKSANAPICLEIGVVADPEALSRTALNQLGLKVSSRNCRRVLDGDIQPVHSIACCLRRTAGQPVNIVKKRTLGSIAEDDLDAFAQAISETFRTLGEKYFLTMAGKPKIKHAKGEIRINLSLEREDSW